MDQSPQLLEQVPPPPKQKAPHQTNLRLQFVSKTQQHQLAGLTEGIRLWSFEKNPYNRKNTLFTLRDNALDLIKPIAKHQRINTTLQKYWNSSAPTQLPDKWISKVSDTRSCQLFSLFCTHPIQPDYWWPKRTLTMTTNEKNVAFTKIHAVVIIPHILQRQHMSDVFLIAAGTCKAAVERVGFSECKNISPKQTKRRSGSRHYLIFICSADELNLTDQINKLVAEEN